ncbi:hypothetical protein MFRU_022g00140 [Monilinia fructicola]|nr:hypothetical protein MFRU_022g00140 [Monilinia fructicola]
MARSIALDVQADGGVLIETVSRDDFSATDHTMALHLYQGPRTADATPEHPSITPPPTQTLDEEFLQKLQILYISGVEAKDGSTSGELDEPDFDLVASSLPESSTLAASWYALLKTMFTKCTICCYQINRYDAARVPVANARLFLTIAIAHAFEKKKTEFEIRNRIYCCSKHCLSFMHPSKTVNEVATCDDCSTQAHTLSRATELFNRKPGHQLLDRPYQAVKQDPEVDAQVAATA